MKFFLSLLVLFFTVTANAQQDTARILFPFDKHHLTADAKTQAENFISNYKKGGKDESIIIRGHCDAIGTDDYNDILAEKRVATVQDYLIAAGIPSSAITLAKGYGERQPLNSNSTAEERSVNRRVEIIVNKIVEPPVVIVEAPAEEEPPAIKETKTTTRQRAPEFSKETIENVKEGDLLSLKNINFYGGRHTFLPEAIPPLTELLEVMQSHPTLVIEIHGHICCRPGSSMDGWDYDANDEKLSVNRARAVYYYLASKGIDKRRMSFRGFAGRHPLVYPEYTERDRTTNRRVEIKIIKK